MNNIKTFLYTKNGSCELYAKYLKDNFDIDFICFPFSDIKNIDTGIFIFPIYAESINDMFLKSVGEISKNIRTAILISVYGNVSPGNALYKVTKIIKSDILGAASFVGSHSYNIIHSYSLGSNRPDNDDYLMFHTFIENTFNKKNSINISKLKKYKKILAHLPARMLAKLSVRLPKVDRSLCINCNACIYVCPFNAIDSSLNIDGKKCVRCLKCAAICEERARKFEFSQPFIKIYLKLNSKPKKNIIYSD